MSFSSVEQEAVVQAAECLDWFSSAVRAELTASDVAQAKGLVGALYDLAAPDPADPTTDGQLPLLSAAQGVCGG